MSDNHILAPKVDLIMAMDDLRLNGCNHSADLLKKALFTAPVSVEPVNWPAVEARISEFVNEYEMVGEDEQGRDGHYTPNESERALILDAMHGVLADDELMALLRPAAPVAAQPDVTQQTLDDVMAGIPARDAEIEALRKEIEALQAAPVKPYSLDLDPAGIRALTADAVSGALALGFQGVNPPPNNEHWLAPFWEIGRESGTNAQQRASGADALFVNEQLRYSGQNPSKNISAHILPEATLAKLTAPHNSKQHQENQDRPSHQNIKDQLRHHTSPCAAQVDVIIAQNFESGTEPSGNFGEFKTDDQMGFVLAAIQHYGSQKWAEGKGLAPKDLINVRKAWDAVYQCVQALAQQDADKVDAALAEMVHAMFRSGNSVPVPRITIDRKQYDAAIDAARKEPDQ